MAIPAPALNPHSPSRLPALQARFPRTIRHTAEQKRWLLRLALFSIPLPWLSCELGCFVAEYGRQPWTIGEVLPTPVSTSVLSAGDLYFSLAGFIGFYTLLLVFEIYLVFKFARLGPSSLHLGRHHFEQAAGGAPALATQPLRRRAND